MIRISKIIHKDDLCKYIEDKDISKISILRRKNNLKNRDLIKIYLFVHVDWGKFCTMIGQLKVLAKKEYIGPGVNPFLNGAGNCKMCGFIGSSDVEKLISFEQLYGINCAIPTDYTNIIKKYK
jgi:hypothetical protein